MRAGFHTFGCKLNQHETEALAGAFREAGFDVGDAREPADLYVVNTCTVTSTSDHKARALVRSLCRRRPGVPVIVTGCSAQLEAASLAAIDRSVVVVSQADKPKLIERAAALASAGRLPEDLRGVLAPAAATADPFAFRLRGVGFHARAFLKVQDGCDYGCAYCRVPLARGRSVSLPSAEVLRRAAALEAQGYREIVLTGVNICSWREGALHLPELLRRLLGELRFARLRLSSLEPEAVTEELAAAVADPGVCRHFHLSVQSGADRLLASMRRGYRRADVEEAATLLRGAAGDPFLAADLLVGFPGETEEDFGLTVELVKRLHPAQLHVFPFSPRPGTSAASMRPPVPERVSRGRAAILGELSSDLLSAYRRRWEGGEVEVLLETQSRGLWRGTSGNYLKVEVAGVPDGTPRGDVVRVRVSPGGTAGVFLAKVHAGASPSPSGPGGFGPHSGNAGVRSGAADL